MRGNCAFFTSLSGPKFFAHFWKQHKSIVIIPRSMFQQGNLAFRRCFTCIQLYSCTYIWPLPHGAFQSQWSSTGSAECMWRRPWQPQTVMNDPGAKQPSQMFLTCVKARPQHRELHVNSLHERCVGSLTSHSYLQQGLWNGTSGL